MIERLPLEIIVRGKPITAGSYMPVPIRRGTKNGKGGQVIGYRVIDDNPKTKPWQQDVRAAALMAMHAAYGADCTPWMGPIEMVADYYFRRPRSHYRTGKWSHLLRPDAPTKHMVKPDVSKLTRAVEDGMTGVVYVDDSRICGEVGRKHWAESSFCRIKIYFLREC